MEEIGRVYARSLFEVANEHDELDQVREELGTFADAMHENRDLATFFFSPYFSVPEKKAGLEKAVTGASSIIENFLQALIERHRMPAIFRIRTEFETLWAQERRLLPVHVITAIELDKSIIEDLGKRIGEQVDRTIEARERGRSRHPGRRRPARGQCRSSTRRSRTDLNNSESKWRRASQPRR